jgi:hypothetical protein
MQVKEASKMALQHGPNGLAMSDAKMPPRTMKTQASLLIRIAFLILGLAIFAWGLQYKLSLYQSSTDQHPVSVAKLIQGDQSKKNFSSIPLQESHSKGTPSAIDSAAVAQRPWNMGRGHQQPEVIAISAILFLPYVHFFRPPPQAS